MLCPALGRLPAELRALTPAETILLVRALNEARPEAAHAPPTDEEYEALLRETGLA